MIAACVGNVVEWYDFAVFGALGVVLVPVFFPADHGADLLLAAFAVYAAAFLARPIGAIVFGRRGDAHGRQGVLASVLLVMTCATAAIGALPGSARIGVVAGVAVVLLRSAQGLAAGGELGLAAVFIAEHASAGRRGAVASWHTATLALGVALGFGVAALVLLLPDDGGVNWWRIPFLIALPLGLVGVYIRRRVLDSPAFLHARSARTGSPGRCGRSGRLIARRCARGSPSLRPAHWRSTPGSCSSQPPGRHDLPHSGWHSRGLPLGLVIAASAAVGLGWLSDRIGRRPVVLGSIAALAVSAVPLWLLATSGSFVALVAAQSVAGIAIAGTLSVALLAELFPTRVRATGLALTAGLSTAILGGTAPLVDQVLLNVTGLEVVPAFYVATVAALALLALSRQPETASAELA